MQLFFIQSSNNKIDIQLTKGKKEVSSMNFDAYMFMRLLKTPSLAKINLTDNIDLRPPNRC